MMVFGKLAVAMAAAAVVVLVAGVCVAVAQHGPVQAAALPTAAQTTQPSASDRGGVVADAVSMKAKYTSLATTLQALRSQLEYYQLHHDGYPTIEQIRNWSVMIKPTTPAGVIVEDRAQATGRVFGPYLASAPSNAFTGLTKVADSSSIDGETGWVMKRELRGRRDRNGVATDVLYAVVPDTPAFHQLFRDAPWVVFSDKVSEAAPATRAAGSRPDPE